MRTVAVILISAFCLVGVAGHAQLETYGPARLIGGGSMHLAGGMSISAEHMEVATLGANAPAPGIESATFRGNVKISQDGAAVKADEAQYDPVTREFVLTGNVRMAIPAPAAPTR